MYYYFAIYKVLRNMKIIFSVHIMLKEMSMGMFERQQSAETWFELLND